mmetsp:Transcript_3341/g.11744  ORF Transcript_3341/g.11744 Transcript_3341/m.11744 type:complete len:241 (-) Transcript_3341:25-747(-)
MRRTRPWLTRAATSWSSRQAAQVSSMARHQSSHGCSQRRSMLCGRRACSSCASTCATTGAGVRFLPSSSRRTCTTSGCTSSASSSSLSECRVLQGTARRRVPFCAAAAAAAAGPLAENAPRPMSRSWAAVAGERGKRASASVMHWKPWMRAKAAASAELAAGARRVPTTLMAIRRMPSCGEARRAKTVWKSRCSCCAEESTREAWSSSSTFTAACTEPPARKLPPDLRFNERLPWLWLWL